MFKIIRILSFKKTKKFVKKIMVSTFLILITTSIYAMKPIKFSANSNNNKIYIEALRVCFDDSEVHEMQKAIKEFPCKNIWSRIDLFLYTLKNYKYTGDLSCFYELLEITLEYIGRVKPNIRIPSFEELGFENYRDKKGFISFEDFKSCLICVLSKVC